MAISDDDYSPLDDFYVTSISKDEALQKLLGWQISCTLSDGSSGELSDEEQEAAGNEPLSVENVFKHVRTQFENDLFQAKHAQQPEAVIAEKRKALADFDKKIEKARGYLCAIEDELSKGDASALRLDKERPSGAEPYITIHSFNEWVRTTPNPAPTLTASTDQVAQTARDKSWYLANPTDPTTAAQPWYTPARYFARQLVIGDSTLLTNRDRLAGKVALSLASVGIFKRGGKKPFTSGTVKKALTKVTLG